MSATNPGFNDEDQFNPVYCTQCKKHVPRASLDASGMCEECRQQAHAPGGTINSSPAPPSPSMGYSSSSSHSGLGTAQQASILMSQSATPADLAGWNWGAFLLNFLWSAGHGLWLWAVISLVARLWAVISLVANFVPFGGIAVPIYLGIKGNEMAWEARGDRTVEEFRRRERAWAIAGLLVIVASILLGFLIGIIIVLMGVHAGVGSTVPRTTFTN